MSATRNDCRCLTKFLGSNKTINLTQDSTYWLKWQKCLQMAKTATFQYLSQESLNSDGQQFHQYKKREQSPLALTHWTQNKTTTYDVGNPGPDPDSGTGTKVCQG